MANDIKELANSIEELRKAMSQNTKEINKKSKERESQSGGQKGLSTIAINRLTKQNDQKLDRLSSIQESGLAAITERLTAEKEQSKFELDTTNLGTKLDKLNSLTESNETSEGLKVLFEDAVRMLENPTISDEERELVTKQINAIGDLAATEEETRENRRLQEEANSTLARMSGALDGLGAKFDQFSSNFKKGAGLLGTLGAIGMLLFDPETLQKMVVGVIEFFEDMYAVVQAFLNGDAETAKKLLMENLGGVGLALGTIAIFFGGSIFRGISAIVKTVKAIASGISKVGKVFVAVGKIMAETLAPVVDKIKSTFTKVGDILKKFGKTFITVGDESSKFSKFGSILKNVFKRIFFPITVIMGIFDAVKGALAGFEEGGIIGGIRGALIGLFDGMIGGAVNMLTGALAWILDKLGFDKAAEALAAFDITEYFTKFIDYIGNMISGAFDWIKGVFAGIDIVGGLTSMWEAYVSTVGSIMDIIFKPIDMAINWIMGIFGFETPEGGFSLKDMIFDTIGKVKDFFLQLFDFLPSLDTIKSAITDLLPDWLKPDEEINIATANEEQLRAMANDNAGFFGDEEEEYQKLVAQKKAAIDTQLSNTPADFIRQETQDTEATRILNSRPSEYGTADSLNTRPSDYDTVDSLNTRPSDYDTVDSADSLNTRPSDYVAIEALERPVPLLEKQRSLSANESEMKAAAAAPIIINNNNSGGGQKAGNTNNVSSATYNISQGVSPDDFVRMDFANRY